MFNFLICLTVIVNMCNIQCHDPYKLHLEYMI